MMSSTHCVLWAPKRFRVIRKATESSLSIGLFAADTAFVDSPDDPECGLLVAENEHSFWCLFSSSFGSFCANIQLDLVFITVFFSGEIVIK